MMNVKIKKTETKDGLILQFNFGGTSFESIFLEHKPADIEKHVKLNIYQWFNIDEKEDIMLIWE